MTAMIKLLSVTALVTALVAPQTLAAAEQCAQNMIDIGAGICAEPESATKRVQPADTDQAAGQTEPPAEVAAENVGRDDGSNNKARTEERRKRIEILTQDAQKPLETK